MGAQKPSLSGTFSIFGLKKLPERGKGMGDGIRGFKAATGREERSRPKANPMRKTSSHDCGSIFSSILGTDRVRSQEDESRWLDGGPSSSLVKRATGQFQSQMEEEVRSRTKTESEPR